jgi:3-hydroxymyristoyl/3-hydroxydecanoyl-(acyl carrier protein) dehydratase
MQRSAEIYFASDHPTASGHFPSNPIIPGALLLDEVVAVIAGEAGGGALMIRAAKFLQPVRPGERVNLSWRSMTGGAIKFECRRGGQDGLAMTGTIEIGRGTGFQ